MALYRWIRNLTRINRKLLYSKHRRFRRVIYYGNLLKHTPNIYFTATKQYWKPLSQTNKI